MKRTACVLAALAALACAGGGENPDTCKIQVVGVEKFNTRPGAADFAYRVKGEAGSPAIASLVAASAVADRKLLSSFIAWARPGRSPTR